MSILKAFATVVIIVIIAALFLPVIAAMTFSGIADAGVAGLLSLRTFLGALALALIAGLSVGKLIRKNKG